MIFNAQELATQWKSQLKKSVESFEYSPIMVVIVAKDFYPPSNIYITNKIKTNEELGIKTVIHEIEWQGRNEFDVLSELSGLVHRLNHDGRVNGVVIQRPFLNFTEEELDIVSHAKDIDGLGVVQKGFLTSNHPNALIPATAYGVVESIKSQFGADLKGLTISIVNRSPLIGIPLQAVLRSLNATVVNLHTKTDKDFTQYMLKNSDIVITATGRRAVYCSQDFSDKVKMIIDCSMDKAEGISGVGDIFQDEVLKNMPNCILSSGFRQTGLLTCVALSANLIKAYEIQNRLK